jgi:hypothetical protein
VAVARHTSIDDQALSFLVRSLVFALIKGPRIECVDLLPMVFTPSALAPCASTLVTKLASVVTSDAISKWTLIPSSKLECQLHAKFWGKEPEEEKERRRAYSKGETMEVDDENMAEIGPNRYALDIGFEDIGCSKVIWIREDHVRIYEYCERYYEEITKSRSPRPPSVVITGQPGIGKCFSY